MSHPGPSLHGSGSQSDQLCVWELKSDSLVRAFSLFVCIYLRASIIPISRQSSTLKHFTMLCKRLWMTTWRNFPARSIPCSGSTFIPKYALCTLVLLFPHLIIWFKKRWDRIVLNIYTATFVWICKYPVSDSIMDILVQGQGKDQHSLPFAKNLCFYADWLPWWLHWLSIGLVIERSLVRLPAGALSSQLGQLSLPSSGVGKSSTGLHGWG